MRTEAAVCIVCGGPKRIDYKKYCSRDCYFGTRRGAPLSDRRCSVEGCEQKHWGRGYCQQHYSKLLQGDNQRQWRSKTGSDALYQKEKAYYQSNPEAYRRMIARKQTQKYIRTGKIHRAESCHRCGAKTKLFAHHEDYSKPLLVEWLCHECHANVHGKEGRFAYPVTVA